MADLQLCVAQLREQGLGILITDHNVRETLGICDRAYIVNEGRIIAEGAWGWDGTECSASSECAHGFVCVSTDGVDFRYAAACNCSFGVGFSNQEMMNVKAGDTVLFGKYAGTEVKVMPSWLSG